MAVFDLFYQHRKEWSYRDFKDLFGNGMAVGTKWEGGQVSMVKNRSTVVTITEGVW